MLDLSTQALGRMATRCNIGKVWDSMNRVSARGQGCGVWGHGGEASTDSASRSGEHGEGARDEHSVVTVRSGSVYEAKGVGCGDDGGGHVPPHHRLCGTWQ